MSAFTVTAVVLSLISGCSEKSADKKTDSKTEPGNAGVATDAEIAATKLSLRSLNQVIKLHMTEQNTMQYPKSLDILMATRDEEGKPLTPKMEKFPTDAWGNKIRYTPPPPRADPGTEPKIWSIGPNKKDENGAGDDITLE